MPAEKLRHAITVVSDELLFDLGRLTLYSPYPQDPDANTITAIAKTRYSQVCTSNPSRSALESSNLAKMAVAWGQGHSQ